MKTGLPALITSDEPSVWASCRVITPNLERAYRSWLGDGLATFRMSRNMTDYDTWNLAAKISRARPARLIFLDHHPNPAGLIRALKAAYGARALPPLFVHVYGDFSLDAGQWLTVEKALKGVRVKFIAASPRQRALVSQMLLTSEKATGVCPFPVDGKLFSSDARVRRLYRQSHGVPAGSGDDSEVVIAYSGRLTLQKNTTRLLREFQRFLTEAQRPARLWLAGGFDDLGAPFFGMPGRTGAYYRSWHNEFLRLPASTRERIEYFGVLSPPQLREFYNAADLFVSLSLHHDEDYGMSPAEALCCGTPAALTDWGGYSAFDLAEHAGRSDCRLIPVQLNTKGLCFTSDDVVAEMLRARVSSPAERAARSREYLSRFSIDAAVGIVRSLHASPPPAFAGFTWRLRELAKVIYTPTPYDEGPRRGTFYEEIYGRYLRTDRLVFLP